MNLFHFGSGKLSTLHDLFIDQLRDLHSAETQLTEALPLMSNAAFSPELKSAFETHLEETRIQIRRLEEIFDGLGVSSDGKVCHAMKGLIQEGREAIHENATPEVKDAALIAAAQRVEHYEMAGYGCVRTYANLMGHINAETLLQTTLEEEEATDDKLSEIAESLNNQIPLGHEKGADLRQPAATL